MSMIRVLAVSTLDKGTSYVSQILNCRELHSDWSSHDLPRHMAGVVSYGGQPKEAEVRSVSAGCRRSLIMKEKYPAQRIGSVSRPRKQPAVLFRMVRFKT